MISIARGNKNGWRGAATASSAALGALFLLPIAVVEALAYSIAGSGNHMLTSGLNDFVGRLRVDCPSAIRTDRFPVAHALHAARIHKCARA
jgi:hypothetical protein